MHNFNLFFFYLERILADVMFVLSPWSGVFGHCSVFIVIVLTQETVAGCYDNWQPP